MQILSRCDKFIQERSYTRHDGGIEKMKKAIIWVFCFFMTTSFTYAQSYCVMSGDDDRVVEEKNMHETQSVASISKIMTAVIAIEQGNLDDVWNVSEAILQAEGSSIYLQVGQSVSLEDLLYGLMLRSGNDAAIEIATHISGDCATFVNIMNEKAKAIGMNDTTFHNPSGLDEEDGGNISSAYDMALLMKYAMKLPAFATITRSQYHTSANQLRWKNKNRLLFDYAQTTGGKTGFTKKAGRTLVSSAQKDGVDSIVVTLGMSDDFEFHEQEHEKVFADMDSYTVLEKGSYQVYGKQIEVDIPVQISLRKDGSDKLDIKSYVEGGNFVVEVIHNDTKQQYTYSLNKISSSKQGWFS